MKATEVLRRYAAGERNFQRINLRGQSFKGEDLSGADFSEADIRSTNFKNANLQGVNFTGTKAGLQKRWVAFLLVMSFLFSGISALFLTFMVSLVFQLIRSNASEDIYMGLFSLIILVIFLIITLRKSIVAGAVAGAVTVAVAFTIAGFFAVTVTFVGAGAEAFAITVACTLFGLYLGWRALKGYERDAWVRSFAVAFMATGGANFQNANLTDANFTRATLKNTDFRKAILTRTCFRNAKKLDLARPGKTYLKNLKIQQWLTGTGQDNNFDRFNLRGVNFQGKILTDASFIGADLSEANLQDADLSRAKLVQTKLDKTDFTGATLTGAIIEDWGITVNTNLRGVICDYIYMRLPTQKNLNPLRKPDNENEIFEDGDFGDFIKPIFDTLDLYHNQNVDPIAIALSWKELAENNPDANLRFASMEVKGEDSLLLKLKTSPEADKSQLSAEYFEEYNQIKALNEANKKLLAEKSDRIKELENMVKLALQTPKYYSEGDHIERDKKDRSRTLNISDSNINSSGAAGFSLGNISGTLANEINLPPSLEREKKNEKEELFNNNRNLCYIHAEMDEKVVINCATTIEVILSKELLEVTESNTSQTSTIKINYKKTLLLQVIPKTNFTIIGKDYIEVNPPNIKNPCINYFDLRPTHIGKGEVWIIVLQGQIPLVTIKLLPEIVHSRTAIQKQNKAKINSGWNLNSKFNEPPNQLTIFERRNGQEIRYEYRLSSKPLNIFLKRYESQPITSERYEYVENLYKEIENRWLSTQDDIDLFSDELRAFGGQLFDQLFPEELQKTLWEHQSNIKSIMVISTEPFIPWELVHLKPPGQKKLPDESKFLGQMGLVRWLYDVGWPTESIQIRNQQVYCIIPQYPIAKYQLPQAQQESQLLVENFKAVLIEPQPKPVLELIKKGQFDLLHFAGHGIVDPKNMTSSQLMLEGRLEGNKYIKNYLNSTTVAQFFCLENNENQPIVVLNACQVGQSSYALTGMSGFAQAFLKGGAGAFVGPLWSVGDRPARIFIETLYSELLKGLNLSEATRLAREKAKNTGDATWLSYSVYGHPHLKLISSFKNAQNLTID